MVLWLTLAVNSIALGGLLFLLSAGFCLIFVLMRIPNLMHGSFFMLGAYFGVTLLDKTQVNFWLAALISGIAMAVIGGLIERLLLRRLAGQELAQVLLTLGLSFIVSDICLMVWTGDPWQPPTPAHLRGAVKVAGLFFPLYRVAIVAVAVAIAIALWLMMDWTRLGAVIRAGGEDAPVARVCGRAWCGRPACVALPPGVGRAAGWRWSCSSRFRPGSAIRTTSISPARLCCTRCSRSRSTSWSDMAASSRSAMPACSRRRATPAR